MEPIKKNNSQWQTQELTDKFLNDVRGAIPGAGQQFAVIGKIVDLWCQSPVNILDLGCGNGILGSFLLDRFPAANCLFLDFSEPMLEAARENIGSLPNATVEKADFSSPQWVKTLNSADRFDIVISGFAIHHQPDERKCELYSEVFNLLSPGGVFLNLEHVASATAAGQNVFNEFFIDHLCDFHNRSEPDVKRKTIASEYYDRPDKEENLLAQVELQCQWLREIGYEDVDCFFKIFELALFGGRKTTSNTPEIR